MIDATAAATDMATARSFILGRVVAITYFPAVGKR